MNTLLQDLRYGTRTLLKTPGFTLIAVLSLALGIGANTAIFSIIDALLLRQLPVRDPGSLALFGTGAWSGIFGGIGDRNLELFSRGEWQEFRKDKDIFQDVAGFFSMGSTFYPQIAGAASTERLSASQVTGNYFTMLGVKPALGRLFTEAEDTPLDAHPVVVISYAWWKRRFAGNPNAIGETMRIGDRIYTIVGVAAPEFFGTKVGEAPQAWFPISMLASLPPYFKLDDKLDQSMTLIGRLQPGVTLQRASTASTARLRRLLSSYLGSNPPEIERTNLGKTGVEITSAAGGLSGLRRNYSQPLQVLMAVVGLVLLIACANVANLLMARAKAREREMAIRFAIGSGRARVIRQFLTESLLLSAAGGFIGILFAMWGSRLLLALVASGPDPIALDVDPNFGVLLFTLAVSFVTGILFGTAPALRASSVSLTSGLGEGRGRTASRDRLFAGRALVVAQVAISLMLVAGAGLFVRSFRNLEAIDTGFEREHNVQFSVEPDAAGYKQDARLAALYERLEQRVEQVPGVRSAALALTTFNQGSMNLGVAMEGHPEIQKQGKVMLVNITGPDYLKTAGIPLLSGRAFTRSDTATAPKVAVIGAKAAREIFGTASPIGRHMAIGDLDKGLDIEIVGVAQDAKYVNLREETQWAVYIPYTQTTRFIGDLVVGIAGNQATVIPLVRQAILEVEPHLPISDISPMSKMVDDSIGVARLIAQLSTFFGALALFLAALGLYGILSYSVVRRTNEIGIRMALGAERARVLGMILRETLLLLGCGVAIGIPAALLCGRFIESMLYGLKSNDQISLAIAVAVLCLIGGFAGLLPARRASQVDPMVALRYE